MKLFAILKIFAQVFGVFPFKRGKIFYFSKLYLVANIFMGFYLVSTAARLVTRLPETTDSRKSTANQKDTMFSTVDTLLDTVVFGRLACSLVAVTTKFLWRREHVEILNSIWDFYRKHNITCILNSPTMFDNVFIAILCLSLFYEISAPIFDILSIDGIDFESVHSSVIEIPIIMDEIIFCVICSALSKYQQEIRRMIVRDVLNGEAGEIMRVGQDVSAIIPDESSQNQPRLFHVAERPMIRRSASSRARNLETFRKMNLQTFNIHSSYSALHELHFLMSITISMVEHVASIFTTFEILTQNVSVDSTFLELQLTKMGFYFTAHLTRTFMICYYNDKAFDEGIAIKYELQEIRRTSKDNDLIKVSKIFMEQLQERKEFEICELFSFNMTLPATFIRHAANYVVVLVQYLGLKV